MLFIPSGGVTVDNAASWLSGGAVAVSLGGALLGDALQGGPLDALADRAAALRAAVDEVQVVP